MPFDSYDPTYKELDQVLHDIEGKKTKEEKNQEDFKDG